MARALEKGHGKGVGVTSDGLLSGLKFGLQSSDQTFDNQPEMHADIHVQ